MLFLAALLCGGCTSAPQPASRSAEGTVEVMDGFGRTVTVPRTPTRVVCSGSGCLRYLVYLQALDVVAGVDSMEKRLRERDGRPYFLAHGERLRTLPLVGEMRGRDDPEKLIALGPDLVFKADAGGAGGAASAARAEALQARTGIPVIAFPLGSLRTAAEEEEMGRALRLLGRVLGRQARAEEVMAFVERTRDELDRRTRDLAEAERRSVYVGGVAFSGGKGLLSTEPAYPPFSWLHERNVAAGLGVSHADVAKEALVDWDPEFLFVDLATLQVEGEGALGQLASDPALRTLSAVREGRVYGVLPYNYYSSNCESVLANAWFIGKTLHPERFRDVDPRRRADELSEFFVGKKTLQALDARFSGKVFQRLSLDGAP